MTVDQLFRLQLIDKRLKEIEKIQKDQSDLRKLVDAKKCEQNLGNRLAELEGRLHGLKHRIVQGEAELAEVEGKINGYQQKLYDSTIRNLKELEGLEAKVESLLNGKNYLEKKLIEVMQEIEDLEKEINLIKNDYNKLKADVEDLEKIYKVKLQKLHVEEKNLHIKRNSLVMTIPPTAYEQYLKAYRQHAGLAVVRVKNNTCTGCMVTLSPALLTKVKISEEMVHCEFCGRILFYHTLDEIEKTRKH